MTTHPFHTTPLAAARFAALASTLLVTASLTVACSNGADTATSEAPADTAVTMTPEQAQARAVEIAQEALILDTHIDVPYRLVNAPEDVSVRTESGDFDWERAREGGLDGAFMSIYIPASYQEDGGAKALADELIDGVEAMAADHPEKFALAYFPEDLIANQEKGLVSLPLGIENGAPIEGDLANLAHFYERGVRYITLTHSKNNHISDSSYEEPDNREWDGLSPFGEEVVLEMNRLGMMVDVSHVSDAAFDDVIAISNAPVIASHSSARHFTPGFERNMSDDMIRRMAEKGGIIQINFGSTFVTQAANEWSKNRTAAMIAFAEETGAERGSDEMRAAAEAWSAENPLPYATVDDVLAHFDHVVEIAGIDHVGIGSDYDGVGDSLPTGLKDVSTYPNLIAAMLMKGYSEDDIRKVLGGNVLRVWQEVQAVAAATSKMVEREAA